MRDSAGVTIVETSRESMEALPQWTLTPEFDMGGADSPAEHEFFRVSGVRLLDDGALAVVNSGSQEVRFFGADGVLQGSVGREGDGPGEFRQPLGIHALPGDSLLVFDRGLKRVTVISPERRIARSVALEGALSTPVVEGLLEGGDPVVSALNFILPDPGTIQDSDTELLRFDPDGALVSRLGTFPAQRWVRVGETRAASVKFSPLTTFAVAQDHVWIGTGRAYEVIQVDDSGALTRIARWWGPDRTVTAADRERWLESRLSAATTPESRSRALADADDAVFAEERGAYSTLLASRNGDLWIRDFERSELESVRWLVLDPTGTPRAFVSTPARIGIMDLLDDRAAAVAYDELDIPHVVLYRIVKQ